MSGIRALRFDGIWIGQLLREYGNGHKRYRVISIATNPDRVTVRAVGGTNRRTIDRAALELCWFPAGATKSREEES